MEKSWSVTLGGITHNVKYQDGFGKRTVTVDGRADPIPTKFIHSIVGLEHPVLLGGQECRLVVAPGFTKTTVDLAVNGVFLDSGKPYEPLKKVPGWAWIFVVLCLLIIFMGGAVPMLVGLLGAYGCIAMARGKNSTGAKVVGCIAVTVVCWAVVFLVSALIGVLMYGI